MKSPRAEPSARRAPDFEWSDWSVSLVRELWEAVSAADIGRRIGTSKDSVVGKAFRLGLPPKLSPIKSRGQDNLPRQRTTHIKKQESTLPPLASEAHDQT